jgi:signal transduction histidine kinase
MKNDSNRSLEALRLRRQAEDKLNKKMEVPPGDWTTEDSQRLQHELEVHQIELEMQNEELRLANHQAEEALDRYIELYDYAPVGYFTLDHLGTIAAVNLTAAILLGEARSKLVGRPFRFFVADTQPHFREFLESVFAGGEKKFCEVALKSGWKSPLYARLEGELIDDGEACRLTLFDITELRQKDFLLIMQNRLAAMGEMIDNIAHQWRMPLNSLGLMIQQLGQLHAHDELSKEFFREGVAKSMELINHMSRTIDDFRNFFKPDKEKVKFRVYDVISHAVNLLDETCHKQKVSISVNTLEESYIHGYPNEFLQVVLNLLNNAIEAATEKKIPTPKIIVTIGLDAGRAVITVADNAEGIPEDIMGQLFDPYVTTKEQENGTGIGLYMSKTIVEKSMGGSLTVRNLREGAEFRIEI